MDTLGERGARRGARPLDLLRRRHHGARSHRHGLGARRQRRHPGAEGAVDAGDRRRRGDHGRRGHRAGCRLGREGIRTTARREGDTYVLNGAKMFITNGVHADLYCVAAKTDARRRSLAPVTMFLVEKGTPGFRVAARSTSTAGAPRTPRSSSSRTAAFRPRTCSARRAAASTPSCATSRTSAS